jgi:hypothetical protein
MWTSLYATDGEVHMGNGVKRLVRTALALIGVTAVALSVTPASAQASQGSPHGGKPRFTLPAGAPTPGPGFRIRSAYKVVRGVQTYACLATGVWDTASTPEALLARYDRPGLVHHYAGPHWASVRDRSTILGTVVTRVPQTGTIAWLLLSTVGDPATTGKELSDVKYVSRVNTTGGVGPTGACTPGTKQSVRYGADYVFWVAS